MAWSNRAGGGAKIDAIAAAEDTECWTEKHDRERQFQEGKRKHRLGEAIALGHVAPAYVSEQEQCDASAQAAHQAHLAAASHRASVKKRAKLQKLPPLDLDGMEKKSCWVADGLWGSVQAILVGKGFVLKASPLDVSLIVVEDVGALSEDVDMCLRLLGGIATTPEVVLIPEV